MHGTRGARHPTKRAGLSGYVKRTSRLHVPIRALVALSMAASVWLVIPDQGQGQAVVRAASGTCTLVRKKRVFVAMSDGAELDDYERAAGAAELVMNLVKGGLCASLRTKQHRLTPSLRGALEAGWRVQLEEVRFDDVALEHASVLLRTSVVSDPAAANAPRERAWRVHLHCENEWQIDSVRDEPAPH
jgi:hypothetical protein